MPKWRNWQTLSQKRRFGRLSERSDENQLQLFNEAEAECKPSAPEQIMEEITYRRPKQKGKRDEQLKDLPVERKEFKIVRLRPCGFAPHPRYQGNNDGVFKAILKTPFFYTTTYWVQVVR
jgi:hypothetical protein